MGVAKLKKMQDGDFIHSSFSLGRMG
jgi:hypothetical protein